MKNLSTTDIAFTDAPVIISPRVIEGSIYGEKGGGKGGGGGGREPEEAPNTLRNNTIARIMDLLCEGPIVGLVNGEESIFLDGVPLKNPGGGRNFSGISWEMRNGTFDQEYMSGFPSVETEYTVNAEVKYGYPVTRLIEDRNVDYVLVKIRVSSLYHQSTSSGDINGTAVWGYIQLSNNYGPWETPVGWTIEGKTMSAYERAYYVKLDKAGYPWQIRVVRLTADSDQSTIQNATAFSGYTAVIDQKLSYPNTAYLGIRIDAQQFGTNVPARVYEIYGRIIQVPSNYNPDTRTYTGIWDGEFQWRYSNNPAWVFYDLLTNPRYGLGREIGEDRADKWGLYAIAQYCDELVNDGRGGKEPRFTFNGTLHNREDAVKVLSALAGAFRGMVFYAGNSIYVSQDRPVTVDELGPRLTPANVINGTFTYEGTSLKARHSVCLTSWMDPSDSYNAAIYVYEDPDSLREFGWRQTDVLAFGCTSEGQAARWAAMTVDGEKYATETVSFSMGLEGRYIHPGTVVPIADPSHAGVRAGGRILAVSHQQVRFDAPFPFDPDEQYKLAVIYPDNTVAELDILNPNGTTNEVYFRDVQERVPDIGSVYIIVATNVNPRLFRILTVTEGDGISINFVGLLYDPNKYARVEEGIYLPPPPTSLYPTGPLKPPVNLAVLEYLFRDADGAVKSAATFSWFTDDPRIVGFEAQWQYPGETFFSGAVSTPNMSTDIPNIVPGVYVFRVRGFDALGRLSDWAIIEVTLMGLYGPPSDVYPFRMETRGNQSLLSWGAVPDLDLSHYQIRYYPRLEGATWETSQILAERVPGNSTTLMVPTRAGTYLIKAVDLVGVESVHATLLVTEDLSMEGVNIVEILQEDPYFDGFKDGTAKYPPRQGLILAHNPDGDFFAPADFFDVEDFFYGEIGFINKGYYYFEHEIDLGAVYTSTISYHLVYTLLYLRTDFFDRDDFFDWTGFFGPDPGDSRVEVEFRTTDQNPDKDAYPDEETWNAIWTDWRTFVYGDVQARAMQFRIILYTTARWVSPLVLELSVEIDMPDRVTSGEDIVIPATAGGVVVPFNPPFLNIPAVVVTVQDLQSYDDGTTDHYTVIEKTSEYFRISINNPQGEPVERTIDYVAQGYGYRY